MQWHQPDNMQTICTLLQTDNHTNTSSLNFLQLFLMPSQHCQSINGTVIPNNNTRKKDISRMQFLSSNQQRQNTDSASMPCSKSDLDAEALQTVVHASYDDGLADAFQCNWLRPQLEQQTPTLAASVHHTPTYSRLPSSRQKSHTHAST